MKYAADTCREKGWNVYDWITDNGHWMLQIKYIGPQMVVWIDRQGEEGWWRTALPYMQTLRVATDEEIERATK